MKTDTALIGLTSAQLRRAADLKERIETLETDLGRILTNGNGHEPEAVGSWRDRNYPVIVKGKRKRRLSAAGRAAIIRAVRRRWQREKAK